MKQLSIFIVAMIFAVTTWSQDTIIIRNGEIRLATIKFVDRTNVQYQNYPQTEDVTHLIDINEIRELRYQDGRYINFAASDDDGTNLTSTTSTEYYTRQYKNPAHAYLMSFIPGCGQLYNDQIAKGFVFIGIDCAAVLTLGLSYAISKTTDNRATEETATKVALVSFMAWIGSFIWSSIDAATTANKLNIANGYVVKTSPILSYNEIAPGDYKLNAGLSLNLSF